jgi:hypothetical protein
MIIRDLLKQMSGKITHRHQIAALFFIIWVTSIGTDNWIVFALAFLITIPRLN